MKEQIIECMRTILSKDWEINGKTQKVWQWIREGKLTAAPSFKGKYYDKAKTRIMYVGHAVNGWEFDRCNCVSLDKTVENVMKQENGLCTLVNAEGYPYVRKDKKQGCYRHINSRFFRLIKGVLELQGESDSANGEINETTWYRDSRNWNEKIVWANLFCVAPKEGGNPTDKFIRPCMEQYVDLLRLEIELYEPDVVIICPLKGYFTPWTKLKSFDEILDCHSYMECNIGNTILGHGTLGKTEVIVCKRPDAFGKSYDEVARMAKVISDYIDSKKVV